MTTQSMNQKSKKVSIYLVAALTMAVAVSAQARDKKIVPVEDSAGERSYSGGNTKFGAGFLTSTAYGSGIGALIELSPTMTLIPFVELQKTSPVIVFNGGSQIKFTIHEVQGAGFHVGGAAAFGNSEATGGVFAMRFDALGGFHFNVGSTSHVQIHLDGGPSFTYVATSPSSTSQFAVGALSPYLGASAFYIF